ncbi:MAG: ATP-binding protein [Lachnospiraceae bacterium]|nr:ATP-binding protein [Lachnospiraceae bacterium]
MLADEIKAGESVYIEFKAEIPKKSEKYIKSVIAFANTAGGKIVIGVDDESHKMI